MVPPDGIVSSLSGIMDDPRVYQISVPLQSGNSGGPLLNLKGEVVGITTSKLNAAKVFQWTGDLPENVNYAIKIPYLSMLLDAEAPASRSVELPIREGSLEELAARISESVMLVVAESRAE